MSLVELAREASPEARALAEVILRDDIDNQAWAAQVGPCLSRRAVARLLDKSEQAVAKDHRLFVVRNADDRPAYPAFQFDGRRPVDGLVDVLTLLADVGDDDLTTLAWLTAPKPSLGGASPAQALRSGEVEAVLALAADWAR